MKFIRANCQDYIYSSQWPNQICQLQTIRDLLLDWISYAQNFNTYFGYFPYPSKTITRSHKSIRKPDDFATFFSKGAFQAQSAKDGEVI